MSDGMIAFIAVSFAVLVLSISGCGGIAKDEPTGQNSVCMTEQAYLEELIRKVPIGDFCKLETPACLIETCTGCETTRCCAEYTVYYASATTADQYAPVTECIKRECEMCP
jgi:proline racemase